MPVILGRAGGACAESWPNGAKQAARRLKSKPIVGSRRGGQERSDKPFPSTLSIVGTCGFDFCYFAHALAETRFKALVGRVIPGAAGKIVGQTLHIRDLFLVVVRIAIVLAVTQVFHEPG